MRLAEAVRAATTDEGRDWLDRALEEVGLEPGEVGSWFPAAGRRMGRDSLVGHWEARHWRQGSPPPGGPMFTWTVDDGARVLLLDALGERAGDELPGLYRYGDAAERRAVLRWIGRLEGRAPACALTLVEDALRTNDPRLVAAALGLWAVRHLDLHAFRHAVLKCVFMGVPLEGIDGLAERADAELAAMLAAYVEERVAAGRSVPGDVWPIIDRHRPGAGVREHR
ncbi:MAG: EboA domain-containing protein [Acidimicrobiia bacterium]